jgi:hypothetical protein
MEKHDKFRYCAAWRMRSTAFSRLTKGDRANALQRLAQARPIGVLAYLDADPSVCARSAAPERRGARVRPRAAAPR